MRKTTLEFAVLLPFLLLSGCSQGKALSESFFAFDTAFEIRVYDGNKKAIEQVKDLLLDISADLNAHAREAEDGLFALNRDRHLDAPSPYLLECLRLAVGYKQATSNYYSPFLFDLSTLSKQAIANGQLLDEAIVEEELAKSNSTTVSFEDGISIEGEANIDLGGVAKGYALDKAKAVFDGLGCSAYMVYAGSSSLLFGDTGEAGKSFTLSLRDYPDYKVGTKKSSTSISSVFEQGKIIDGKMHSHIIDPHDGSDVSDHSLVMLLSPESDEPDLNARLDAYSTAAMNMDERQMEELLGGYSYAVFDGEGLSFSKGIQWI